MCNDTVQGGGREQGGRGGTRSFTTFTLYNSNYSVFQSCQKGSGRKISIFNRQISWHRFCTQVRLVGGVWSGLGEEQQEAVDTGLRLQGAL